MNIDLTHPEILTIEQLQQHLIKFVGSNITNDKYELIQLFYKYIVPLPQRKFRTNRLGVMLTNTQEQFKRKKRSLTIDSEITEKFAKFKSVSSANEFNSQLPGKKHESDRGIYTITMGRKEKKTTAPIKLKRPTLTTAIIDDQGPNKHMKLDE